MTPAEAEAIILSFPGVEPGLSWNTPSFKAYGKFFTRIRDEDASIVLQAVSRDEREMLIEAEPKTFHFTDHYRNFPIVLARLAHIDAAPLQSFLERRWRQLAPKKVVKAWDAAT
jgi:hypothetical protein